MSETATALTKEAIIELVNKTNNPVIQINLVAEPQVLAYSKRIEQKGGIPYILVITEEGPALLSLSLERPQPIPPDEMPEGLRRIYDERTGIGPALKKRPGKI